MRAARGLVLVRPAESAETFADGRIIIPQNVREGLTAYQCEIVDVGLPEICTERKCQRLHYPANDAKPVRFHYTPALVKGDWVLVRPRSFVDAGHPTEKLYFVHQNNIEAVFRYE